MTVAALWRTNVHRRMRCPRSATVRRGYVERYRLCVLYVLFMSSATSAGPVFRNASRSHRALGFHHLDTAQSLRLVQARTRIRGVSSRGRRSPTAPSALVHRDGLVEVTSDRA